MKEVREVEWLNVVVPLVVAIGVFVLIIWLSRGEKEDLPKNAIKYDGSLNDLLQSAHEKYFAFNRRTGISMAIGAWLFEGYGAFDSMGISAVEKGKPTKESLRFFNGRMHPTVDGYMWFLGVCIPLGDEKYILLYVPWIYRRLDTRPYAIYLLGDVSEKEVEKIISKFYTEYLKQLEEKEAQYMSSISQ